MFIEQRAAKVIFYYNLRELSHETDRAFFDQNSAAAGFLIF
jgi:hypothetical protein